MSNKAERTWDKATQPSHTRDFHVALCWRGKGKSDPDQFIGYDKSFTEAEARKEQQRIIDSPTYRSQDAGSMAVVVMHWRTWKRVLREGNGCTINRIEQNMRMYGTGLTSVSTLAKRAANCGHLVRA